MNRRTRTYWFWAALAIGAALLAAAALRLWLRYPGDVDPAGAGFALVGTAITALSWWQAQRLAATDVEAATALLARRVLAAEKAQRAQLVGGKGKDSVIDVRFSFVPGGGSASAPPSGDLRHVAAYFRDLPAPRRLVVAGRAGSGKTVLAIELILELLDGRRPDDPVPVRISAAGLDPGVPVADLLARHLVTAFGLRAVTARTLVEAERILPVIDGLDEMDDTDRPGYGSRAARALRALEDYEHGRERCSLVVTCRTGQYDALIADRAALRGAARVEMDQVSGDQAWRFIQDVTDQRDPDRWRPVLDALTTDGHVLAEALGTPWRLTLAVSVYEERDPLTGRYVRSPEALTRFADEAAVREHLLGLFIPARLAAAGLTGKGRAGKDPTAAQTHAWLAVLAGWLRGNESGPPFHGRVLSGTDLVPHRLWPLAGDRSRAADALVALATALPGVAVVAAGLALAVAQLDLVDGRLPGRTVLALALLLLPGVVVLGLLAEPVRAWREVWPAGDEAGSPGPRDPRDRRKAVAEGVLGAAGGSLAGVGTILKFGSGPPLWVPVVFGLLLGVGMAIGRSKESGHAAFRDGVDPGAVVRNDAVSTLVAALTFGPGLGFILGIWLPELLDGLPVATAVAAGAVFGMSVVASWSPELSRRYLGLLLATRGRLPWRLGGFLRRCYGAGLLRVSGIAYQFRHRELQDYLAAHPEPPGGERPPR
ncbi:NACHT domain-containing protein [Actinomadura sp. ATCC 31491]|uniref:NACHT domain-containing protein n=1 Tax=Actinomadura luzonensis TaxID=2805427 RepID=A0ABT0FYZ0_9ACTN|nr:NACHT domain-containing protein [Actinomadura luzonensis]MCK2217108.1 NACHT domain-containing protein [Actinomadura luzonensis]